MQHKALTQQLLIAWPAERVLRDLVSPPLGCAAVQLGVMGVKLLRVKEGEAWKTRLQQNSGGTIQAKIFYGHAHLLLTHGARSRTEQHYNNIIIIYNKLTTLVLAIGNKPQVHRST